MKIAANNIQQYIKMFLNKVRTKSNSVSDRKAPSTAQGKTRKRTLTQSFHSEQKLDPNSSTYYMKSDHVTIQKEEAAFTRTAQKLTNNHFHHHNEEDCCCKDCNCGRHLCKFNVIKPGFTKKTIYRRSYYKQKPVKNIVNRDKEYEKLKGPHLDMKSTYSEGFKPVKGDQLTRPHPQDLLHTHGHCQQNTSYSHQFPGFKGDNQYVKPTNRHAIAYFPLRAKSMYSGEYVNKKITKDDYTYIPDQLKTGSNWFGRTTYGQIYSQPNAEYFAKKVKVVQKREENPNYSRQYQTSYQNEFKEKQNPLCPAKVYLETKGKGVFSGSKSKFAENSDFKALSPEYHAISNSKHYYV